MTTEATHDMLHAKTQLGYLTIKLAADEFITKEEARKALAVLFPDVFPQP